MLGERDEADRVLGLDRAQPTRPRVRRRAEAGFAQRFERDEIAILRFACHALGYQIVAPGRRASRPAGRGPAPSSNLRKTANARGFIRARILTPCPCRQAPFGPASGSNSTRISTRAPKPGAGALSRLTSRPTHQNTRQRPVVAPIGRLGDELAVAAPLGNVGDDDRGQKPRSVQRLAAARDMPSASRFLTSSLSSAFASSFTPKARAMSRLPTRVVAPPMKAISSSRVGSAPARLRGLATVEGTARGAAGSLRTGSGSHRPPIANRLRPRIQAKGKGLSRLNSRTCALLSQTGAQSIGRPVRKLRAVFSSPAATPRDVVSARRARIAAQDIGILGVLAAAAHRRNPRPDHLGDRAGIPLSRRLSAAVSGERRRKGTGPYFQMKSVIEMVLQERIELSTSPLPRECSTTELLQRLRRQNTPKERGACAIGAGPWQAEAREAKSRRSALMIARRRRRRAHARPPFRQASLTKAAARSTISL